MSVLLLAVPVKDQGQAAYCKCRTDPQALVLPAGMKEASSFVEQSTETTVGPIGSELEVCGKLARVSPHLCVHHTGVYYTCVLPARSCRCGCSVVVMLLLLAHYQCCIHCSHRHALNAARLMVAGSEVS